MRREQDYNFCPASIMLDLMGRKWTLVVFTTLCENGKMRFNELFRSIPTISERMLGKALKEFEIYGMTEREVFPEVPPRVEYHVSPLGMSFYSTIKDVIEWSKKHYDDIKEAYEANANE